MPRRNRTAPTHRQQRPKVSRETSIRCQSGRHSRRSNVRTFNDNAVCDACQG